MKSILVAKQAADAERKAAVEELARPKLAGDDAGRHVACALGYGRYLEPRT